jgi:serine phosphatase RsbU (regulator of sigma subunit)
MKFILQNLLSTLVILLTLSTPGAGQQPKVSLDSCQYYISQGQHAEAITNLSILLSDSSTLKKTAVFKIYDLLGKAYYDIGDKGTAALNYNRGLEYARNKADSSYMAYFYMQLAAVNVHSIAPLSRKQIATAEIIYNRLKDSTGILKASIRKASILMFEGRLDSAMNIYATAIPKCEKLHFDSILTSIYLNLGVAYGQRDDIDLYKYYTNIAIQKGIKSNDKKNLALAYANYCAYFLEINLLDSCEFYAYKAIEIANKINYLRPKIVAYQNLLDVSERRKNYRQAYDRLWIYKAICDSFNLIGNDIIGLKNQLEGDFKTREDEITRQNFIKEIESENRLNRQKMITISAIIILLMMGAAGIIILNRYRIIKKQETIIKSQHEELKLQHITIEAKQKDIVDSINYAKRLQNAILSDPSEIRAVLPNTFVLYIPKDIVAGDFYFFEEYADHYMLAAADCTGHGVPGAILSVVCANALSQAIQEFDLTDPGQILDKTRDIIIDRFSKSTETINDGMDISLLVISKKYKTAWWSGAHNSLYYTVNGQLTEVKANRQSVGPSDYKNHFTTHKIDIQEKNRTTFYLLTDGFADQFGGTHGKKYRTKELKLLIEKLSCLHVMEQQKELETVFHDWKGNLEQLDDICILGIEIS